MTRKLFLMVFAVKTYIKYVLLGCSHLWPQRFHLCKLESPDAIDDPC